MHRLHLLAILLLQSCVVLLRRELPLRRLELPSWAIAPCFVRW
jgi:hypothetical protein